MDQHRPVRLRPACPLPRAHTGSPTFDQVVDGRRGSIRAHGDLTAGTADQLRSTVEALLRNGHRRIVVDLFGLDSADEPGMRTLRTLPSVVDADGGRLTLLGLPDHPRAPDPHDDGLTGTAPESSERAPSACTAPMHRRPM